MNPVTFSSQGQKIFGNLHLPIVEAPCIICLHGLESSKDSIKWLAFASRLFEEGYACLRFNFRGCGEGVEKSEGRFEDTTLSARIMDYRAALEYLREVDKVDLNRLGVVASSFGGMVALAAQDRNVKAMVTLASPYIIPPRKIPLKKSFYEDLEIYDILRASKDSPPLLIIHGDSDEIVPLDHASKLYEAASEPKKLEVIKGGDHIFSQPENLYKVISFSLAWFRKHL